DIHYLNSGDWVESLTAIIEHNDGRMELVRYEEFLNSLRKTALRPEVKPSHGSFNTPVNSVRVPFAGSISSTVPMPGAENLYSTASFALPSKRS
ncbi:MAG TPA: hypothetical protein VF258_05250, partial [Luteolibacter sp.]